MRWLRAIGGLLAALPLIVLVMVGGVLWLSQPPQHDRGLIPALDGPVSVRFDPWQRPYVEAGSLGDALAAQGFLHARDRLWQMELLRRAGHGRLAEVLGEAALATDEKLHRVGLPGLAVDLEANASPPTRELIRRYVAGVNAAMETLRLPPPEFLLARFRPGPWREADAFAVAAVMAFDSSRNADNELLRMALAAALAEKGSPEAFDLFLPDEARFGDFPYLLPAASALDLLQQADAASMPRPRVIFGSNGWVVAPERSRDGHALFAFDSHDGWGMPNLMYETHLFFPGEDGSGKGGQLRGWGVPGLPGIINGFNEHLAWGFTSIGDSQDLYIETRAGEASDVFEGRAGTYRARQQRIEIPVRGRDEPYRFTLMHTENGPLMSDEPPVSMAWSARHLGGLGLDGLFELNRADGPESLHRALDRFPAPSAHLHWADTGGRVGGRVVGRLPRRGRGDGLMPLDARAADTVWRGHVPMTELPRVTDPDRGYLAAANARVAPPEAAVLVSADNAPGYRMRRLQQVLSGRNDFDLKDMARLQGDVRNLQAERLLPLLLPSVSAAELDAAAERALELLLVWQQAPEQSGDSAAALIFEQWYLELAKSVFEPVLGADLQRRLFGSSYVLNHALDSLLHLPEAEALAAFWWRDDMDGMILGSFESAVDELGGQLGEEPDHWRWDALHRLHFEHQLGAAAPLLDRLFNRGPYRLGGGNATLGRARYNYNEPFAARGGATIRTVIRLSEPMEVRAIMPGGQGGHPLSPHYDDQFPAFLRGELHVLPRTPGDIGNVSLTLTPDNG